MPKPEAKNWKISIFCHNLAPRLFYYSTSLFSYLHYSMTAQDISVRARGRAGGAAGPPLPPPKNNNSWQLRFFGQQEKVGQSQFLKTFSSFFWIERYFLFLPEVCIVKPVKFTRDSGCLAIDELLVISKGDHKLIYLFLFFWHSTVRHCTSWCCKLMRINFGITF